MLRGWERGGTLSLSKESGVFCAGLGSVYISAQLNRCANKTNVNRPDY
jgi:hypothetical protein